MIRINLLGVERPKARRLPAFTIQAQQLTIACSLVLVAAFAGVGWWYWSLTQSAAQVETDITTAQQELQRLQSVLAEVRQFETRRTQLQQRVQLVEQLRAGQTVPVQLFDHISRSVPEMLWLTDMEQKGTALTIQGRANVLAATIDLAANLKSSNLLKDIDMKTEVETLQPVQGQPSLDLYRFTVTAEINKTEAAKPPSASGGAPAGGGGAGAAAR
jgi:type IV pilus assembly protein PilN